MRGSIGYRRDRLPAAPGPGRQLRHRRTALRRRPPHPSPLVRHHRVEDPYAVGVAHAARHGDSTRLNALLDLLKSGGGDVTGYSAGLHIDTFCSDSTFPWGRSDTPLSGRQAKLNAALRRIDPSRFWPCTRAISAGSGFTQECLRRHSRPSAEPPARLPNVPVLLVNGDHDLSTPMEWAYEEARHAPNGKVVIVRGASHSIENRELGHAGRDAVIAFLNG
jgi:pimeloyl-ACP methyl ester carboxylesterase